MDAGSRGRSRDAPANEERQARKASGGRGFGGRDKKAKDAGGPGKTRRRPRRTRGSARRCTALADGAGARRRRRVGGGASRAGAERRFGHPRGPHDDVRGEARDVRGGRRRHRGLEGDVLSREARAESRRGAASGGVAPGVLRGFVLGPAVLLPRRRVVDLVLPVPLRAHGLGLGGRSRRAHRAVRLRRAFPPVRAAPRRAAPAVVGAFARAVPLAHDRAALAAGEFSRTSSRWTSRASATTGRASCCCRSWTSTC